MRPPTGTAQLLSLYPAKQKSSSKKKCEQYDAPHVVPTHRVWLIFHSAQFQTVPRTFIHFLAHTHTHTLLHPHQTTIIFNVSEQVGCVCAHHKGNYALFSTLVLPRENFFIFFLPTTSHTHTQKKAFFLLGSKKFSPLYSLN